MPEGPPETKALAEALNRLAERITELLVAERATVGDLSHRLRTPVTALRIDVEGVEDAALAERLRVHVGNLQRSIDAIVKEARRPVRHDMSSRCDAVAVVRERVGFWAPLAEDQARRVTLDVPAGPVWVRSADEDLAAALDALLENVVAHTPEGTAFTVRLAPAEEGVHLDVLDDGPGIPATALQRGRSDRGSTGLGLDIARAAAEASGGSLELLHDPAAHGVRLFLRTETQPALTES